MCELSGAIALDQGHATMALQMVPRLCRYIEAKFESQPKDYRCPVCNAPKRRFAVYKEPVNRNANSTATRKARKAELQSGRCAAMNLPCDSSCHCQGRTIDGAY